MSNKILQQTDETRSWSIWEMTLYGVVPLVMFFASIGIRLAIARTDAQLMDGPYDVLILALSVAAPWLTGVTAIVLWLRLLLYRPVRTIKRAKVEIDQSELDYINSLPDSTKRAMFLCGVSVWISFAVIIAAFFAVEYEWISLLNFSLVCIPLFFVVCIALSFVEEVAKRADRGELLSDDHQQNMD